MNDFDHSLPNWFRLFFRDFFDEIRSDTKLFLFKYLLNLIISFAPMFLFQPSVILSPFKFLNFVSLEIVRLFKKFAIDSLLLCFLKFEIQSSFSIDFSSVFLKNHFFFLPSYSFYTRPRLFSLSKTK